MRLEKMHILEKADELEKLIAKTDLDVQYAITVRWRNNAEEDKRAAKILIENTRTMFVTSRISSLDADVQSDAYANYHTALDSCLMMFPEYVNNDIITESVSTQRHI